MRDSQSDSQATGALPKAALHKSSSVALGLTALLAAGLTGCSSQSSDPEYAAVCVDANGNRVDDSQCSEDFTDNDYDTRTHVPGSSLALWYFIGRGMTVPPLGGKVLGGSYARPATGLIASGFTKTGGAVSKGGFGATGKSYSKSGSSSGSTSKSSKGGGSSSSKGGSSSGG